MAIYKLINPSDDYTLESDNFKVACAAALILGKGAYALEGDESMPIMVFSDGEWFRNKFTQTLDEFFDSIDRQALADCLDSVLIGDRGQFGIQSLLRQPDEREAFRLQWHDERRSSLNDIGRDAWELASRLRAK